MKKLLLLSLCVVSILEGWAQNPNSDSPSLSNIETTIQKQPIIEIFNDRILFEDAYSFICGGTLVTEDFGGGPGAGAMMVCGNEISSAGDPCFPPGEIVEGIVITVANPNNFTVFYGSGSIGNSDHLVGDAAFPEYSIIHFTDGNVFAAGHTVFNTGNNITGYRIYNQSDEQIGDYLLNEPPETEYFFGFISDEPISRVEIEGADVTGNFFGMLSFGNCPILSTEISELERIAIVPNPVSDTFRVDIPESIELFSIETMDMQGRTLEHSTGTESMNISAYPSGIYFVRISTSEGIKILRFLKL